jgi:hypothetical protein
MIRVCGAFCQRGLGWNRETWVRPQPARPERARDSGRDANLVAALGLRGIGPDAVLPIEETEERCAVWALTTS